MIRERRKIRLLLLSVLTNATAKATNTTEGGVASLFILPNNRHDERIGSNHTLNMTKTETVTILGDLASAEDAVFQVSNDKPAVTMHKALSFEDHINNGKYDFTSFQMDDTGDTLNIMSISGENGIPRFVG